MDQNKSWEIAKLISEEWNNTWRYTSQFPINEQIKEAAYKVLREVKFEIKTGRLDLD